LLDMQCENHCMLGSPKKCQGCRARKKLPCHLNASNYRRVLHGPHQMLGIQDLLDLQHCYMAMASDTDPRTIPKYSHAYHIVPTHWGDKSRRSYVLHNRRSHLPYCQYICPIPLNYRHCYSSLSYLHDRHIPIVPP
jgi:hypothetical protein